MALFLANELHAEALQIAQGSQISIWTALVSLGAIGILLMYLSSIKVKSLTKKFQAMQQAQQSIEWQQSMILDVIGKRIKTSTHGIRRHRELFEQQAEEGIDPDAIRNEMVRFKRDESLLVDALADLNDFALIRSGTLPLEHTTFALKELLGDLSRHVEPHYFLKRNELVYRFDPKKMGSITGDIRRVEQILSTLLIELGRATYDETVTLSMQPSAERTKLVFDVMVSRNDESLGSLDHVFKNELLEEQDVTQYSSRKLKNYLARELIRLMGGDMKVASDSAHGVYFRIELPLVVADTLAQERHRLSAGAPVLVVAHNAAVALAVTDMISWRKIKEEDVVIDQEPSLSSLSKYDTVVITYYSLTEAWIAQLHKEQQERPVRIIILKSGFQRTLSLPALLEDVQTLKLPLLADELHTAIAHPRPSETDTRRTAS